MFKNPELLRETHNTGATTREWLVHLGDEALLAERGIHAVGWVESGEGYRVIRHSAVLSLIYVCLEGWGEVFVDGLWQRCEPGMAYLVPLGSLCAYASVKGIHWKTCWVLGRNDALLGARRPALVPASGKQLCRAIQGLYYEDTDVGEVALVGRWLDLIVAYTRRIGHAGEGRSERLGPLWEQVAANPAHTWTVSLLAQYVAVSEESLRCICQQEKRHSPMEYVTYLRMRHAASLLRTHPYTISEVAQQVGYSSQFAFSSAFKRILGLSPSEHRRQVAPLSESPFLSQK